MLKNKFIGILVSSTLLMGITGCAPKDNTPPPVTDAPQESDEGFDFGEDNEIDSTLPDEDVDGNEGFNFDEDNGIDVILPEDVDGNEGVDFDEDNGIDVILPEDVENEIDSEDEAVE